MNKMIAKLLMGVLFVLGAAGAHAQSVANYALARTTGNTYTSISGTGTSPSATATWRNGNTNTDDNLSGVLPIGFTFYYRGVPYTSFSASTNGFITFNTGTAATGGGSGAYGWDNTNFTGTSGSLTSLAIFYDDQQTAANASTQADLDASIKYQTSGTAGSRVLTVEWINMQDFSTTSTSSFNYQIKLFEADGHIEYNYSTFTLSNSGTVTTMSYSLGINSPSISATPTAAELLTQQTVNTATFSNTVSNSLGGATPANMPTPGTRYTFTPPAPAAPTTLTYPSIGVNSITVGWTDNSTSEYGFVVTRATDAAFTANVVNTIVASTTTAGTGTTYSSAQTGLSAGTLYYFKITPYSEGMVFANLLSGSQATTTCSISGTKTVGASGADYTSLAAALTAIKTGGLSGNTILELQTNFTTPENLGTGNLDFSGIPCLSSSATLTIRPASGVASVFTITSANTTATVDLNGASYVTIDGRNGGTGTNKFLTFANTSTATGGTAVRLINDATNNAIRYTNLSAVFASTSSGVINFMGTSGTTGNDNNTIDNCSIDGGAGATASPTAAAQNGIYSSGSTSTTTLNNSGNTISNNNIFNCFMPASASNGINISAGSTDWTISGNSIYQTSSRTTTTSSNYAGIIISSSGNNFSITGNFVGGNAASASGTTTINGTVGSRYRGISLSVGTTTASSVQGNTVAGWSVQSSSGATTLPGVFTGIYLTGGNANIGTVTANTIGSGSGTGNITSSTSTTGGVSFGIGVDASSTVSSISNNVIGSFTVVGTTTSISHAFVGIQTTAGTTLTLNNNTIGSTATANSINASTAATGTTAARVSGIENSSSATIAITNNTIANLNSAYVPSAANTNRIMAGIVSSAGVNTITGNTIRNISVAAQATGTGSTASVIGISMTSTTASATIAQNTIHTLSNGYSGAAATAVTGLHYNGPTTGTNAVYRNFIHSLTVASSTSANTAGVFGINVAGGTTNFHNNMIRLGIDATGTSVTGGYNFTGINDASGTNNYYFNSVYIGGTGVVSALNLSTYAFISAVTLNTRAFQNNIFVNARSNSTGTGKHYAVQVAGTTANPSGLTINNNDYLASGTGGVFGFFNSADVASIAAWRTAVGQDGNSINVNPPFITPGGTSATVDLHVTAGSASGIESAATTIAGINFDFDNQVRPGGGGVSNGGGSAPDMGADEGDFTSAQTKYYSKSTGNLDDVNTWGTNTDGSGTNPANFTAANQSFNIRNNTTPTIGAAWTVSGAQSSVTLGDGTNAVNFTIPSSFALTGTINVSNSATLTIQNTSLPTFGGLNANSTIDFASTGAQTIPSGIAFGNLTSSSTGARTLASSGTIFIAGTFTPGTNAYTVTSSTVSFNGLSAQTIPTFTFNNLLAANAAGLSTAASPTVNTTFTVSENFSIASSGTLTIASTGNCVINGSKQLIIAVGGTLQNNSVTALTINGTLLVNGSYVHNANASTIPSTNTTYAAGSNLKVGDGGANITSTPPALPATIGGNVIWNCPSQSAGVIFIPTNCSIGGNLTIVSTGSQFVDNGSGSTTRTLNVAGTLFMQGGFYAIALAGGTVDQITNVGGLNISGGELDIVNGAVTSNAILTNTGNLTLSGGILAINNGVTTATGNGTLNNNGDITVNGGTLYMNTGTSTGNGILNLKGNLTHSSGFITRTNTAPSNINCTGTSSQTINTIGLSVASGSGTHNLTINNAAGVSLNSNININGILTLTSGNFNVGSNQLTLSGGLMAGTLTNLAMTSASSFAFAGSTTGHFVPSHITALNNLSLNYTGASGVTLNGPLNAASLTMTAGKLNTTSTNILTITGTSAGAVTGGSSTSYVNGPMQRTLPANLSGTNTYLMPVGKTAYIPFDLINPTTNAGGAVVIKAEGFDGSTGGTAGTNITSLNTNHYWNGSITSGAGNFTNTQIRITDVAGIGSATALGQSATQAGSYNLASSSAPVSGSITSNVLTSLDYFVMGVLNIALTDYYSKATGNLDDVTTWGTNTDGSGTNPANFTADGQTFHIQNNAIPTIGAAWTVTGAGSKVYLGDGTNAVNFTIPGAFAVTADMYLNAVSTLTDQNAALPNLISIDLTSTVDFASASPMSIPAFNFGSLTSSNTGARTLASSGTIGVAGIFTPGTNTFTATGSTLNFNGSGAQNVPGFSYNNLTIASAGGATVTGNASVDGLLAVNQNTAINSGVTVTLSTAASASIASAKQLTVNGTILNNSNLASAFTVTGTLQFASGSVYQHNVNGGTTIPSANTTYAAGSLLKVTGTTTSINQIPATIGGDVEWNCPSQTVSSNFVANVTTAIGGNLTIVSTGTGYISNGLAATARTVNVTGNLVMQGGTYNIVGNNASATANQTITAANLNMNGGILNLSTNQSTGAGLLTLNAAGNATVNGGTLTVSATTASSGTATMTVPGSLNINTGGTVIITSSAGTGTATISVDGNVNVSGGTLNMTSATGSSAAVLAFKGNLNHSSGTITRSGTSAATFNCNGTSAQTLTTTGLSGTGNYSLTTNNAAGVSLGSNLSIGGTLTLTSGLLNLGNFDLTLGASATVSGTPSSTNMVAITGTGQLKKTFNGVSSFTFPVGETTGTTEYSPVALNFTANSSAVRTIGVKVTDANPPANGAATNYLSRYWSFTDDQAGTYTYTSTFTYLPADINGAEANIAPAYYNGSSWTQVSGSAASNVLTISPALSETSGLLNGNIYTGRSTPPTLYTWTGNTSTDWNDGTNWDQLSVPNAVTHAVLINTGSGNMPVISAGAFSVQSLTINNAAATLTVSGGSLAVSGGGATLTAGQLITSNAAAVTFSSALTIPTGFTITQNNTSAITASGVNAVSAGGTLTLNNSATFSSTGTFSNAGTVNLNATSNLTIAGSNFTNTGTFAAAVGSTITLSNTTGYVIPNITYGNLSITGSGATYSQGSNISIAGNYNQTNGTYIVTPGASAYTQTVGGNFTQSAGTFYVTGVSATAGATVTVNGNTSIFSIAMEGNSSNTGSTVLFQANGNATFTGSSTTSAFDWMAGGSGGTIYDITFAIKGNFNWTNSTGKAYTSGSGTAKGFVFNGTGTTVAPQTLTYSGATADYGGIYTVNSGTVVKLLSNVSVGPNTNPYNTFTVNGTLDAQTFVVSGGSGTANAINTGFTLASGATLLTQNTSGVTGSVTVSVKNFNAAANYVFNGVANQNTGFSNTTMNNLTIANTGAGGANTVTVNTAAPTVNGTLAVNTGILDAATFQIVGNATNQFTLASGTKFRTSGLTTANFPTLFTNANCVFDVNSTFEYYGATPTIKSGPTYGNLMMTTSGSHAAGGALTVAGDLTINSPATLAMGANDITLTGNFSNAGTYTQTSTNSIIFNKNGDQTVSGAGTTSFQRVTLNKTSVNNRVLGTGNITISTAGVTDAITYTAGTWEQSAGTLTFGGASLQTVNSATGKLITSGSGSISFSGSAACTAGLLQMNSSGTMTVGGSGNRLEVNGGTIQLTSGTVNVGGRIGNNVNPGLSTSGTLIIEGATVNVPATALNNSTAGVFMVGSGTTFNMTSGVLNILTANQGAYTGNDIEIQTGTLSGGTITIGGATPGASDFLTKIDVPVNNNLTVNTGSNTALLTANLTTGGTLNLIGTLSIAANTLTVNGPVTGAGSLTGSVSGTTSGSNLVINGTAGTVNFTQTSAATRSLNNVTLGSGASATLGSALDVYGTVALTAASLNLNAKNLTLKSNTTNTARIANLTGSTLTGASNVTMERYIKLRAGGDGRAYRLLAPTVNTSGSINANWMEGGMNTAIGTNVDPVPGFGTQISGSGGNANGFDKTQSNAASLYSTANGVTPAYTAIGSTAGTLNPFTGYFMYVRGDRNQDMTIPLAPNMPTSATTLRTTGTLVTGTQTSFTNAFTGGGALNLVTNPYPSPIDWSLVKAASSNITDFYTFWDPNFGTRGGFVTVSSAGIASSGLATQFIQSGQAFFVESDGGVPAVSIQEGHKAAGNNNEVFLTPPPPVEGFRTELYFTEPNNYRRVVDGALAVFNNGYSKAVDANDAKEINNWDENIAIARDGKHLAIEGRPVIISKDTLPLFMNNMKQQAYEFEFTPAMFSNPNLKAELVDNFLNTRTLLSVTQPTTVSFTVTADAASKASDRFMVVFGSFGGPLAIDAITIKANKKNNGVQVDWTSKTETDMVRYEVERSTFGTNFAKVNTTAAIGNSSTAVNYGWFDASPLAGTNFYRVKAIDRAGNIKYSDIVQVTIGKGEPGIVVYPNPVQGRTFKMDMNNLAKGTYQLSLYNNMGQLVYTEQLQHDGSQATKTIDLKNDIAKGAYQLQLSGSNGFKTTQRIIKN